MSYLLTALGAYLLGSIPTGYLAAKAKGIDIRSVGSGNIGATNAMRVLGKPAGIFVLFADAWKGYAAVKWLPIFLLNILAPPDFDKCGALTNFHSVANFRIMAGICVILGHNYTCWLKFKGGKGIATSAGVFLALAPLAMGICVAVFAVTFLLTRYVSVGSIAAALALPVAVWFTREGTLLRVVTIILGALAIYKHKTNIQRLRAGTENRINFKKKETK
ncbi:MAG: glycerol-3-phosphate 1-O-acyltransferase PlsY [Verrucomicrobia bacterium]|nr:glycerol-3-phosphate 1-O-acyltransferase PlsY [Verrucomicrobiota bacterium]